MSNLGVYVDSLQNSERTQCLYAALNQAINDGLVDDVSLFYNNVGRNDDVAKFGLFNSTDLWAFTGNLLVTDLSNIGFVKKVVNNFDSYYFMDDVNDNVIDLIFAANDVKVLAKTQQQADYFHRTTGRTVEAVVGDCDIKQILEAVK